MKTNAISVLLVCGFNSHVSSLLRFQYQVAEMFWHNVFFPSLYVSVIVFSLSKTDINKVMEEKEAADEPSWKEKCESAAAVEEKVCVFFCFLQMFSKELL